MGMVYKDTLARDASGNCSYCPIRPGVQREAVSWPKLERANCPSLLLFTLFKTRVLILLNALQLFLPPLPLLLLLLLFPFLFLLLLFLFLFLFLFPFTFTFPFPSPFPFPSFLLSFFSISFSFFLFYIFFPSHFDFFGFILYKIPLIFF